MDADVPIAAIPQQKIPTGPSFADEMAAFYQRDGMTPPTEEEIANVPPWTKEEADTFERAVKEAGGHVGDASNWP